MKRPLSGISVLTASIFIVLSCQNPASLGNVDVPETAAGKISIELTGLSPVFEELFSAASVSDVRSVSSRAFIGASRAQFELFDITDAEHEIKVDSWSLPIVEMSNGSGYDTVRTASHSIASSINVNGTLFRLEANIYNDTVSTSTPVVTGIKSDMTITPDTNNPVTITCVPSSSIELVSGMPQFLEPQPFVLVDSMVTAIGGEAWYRIVVTGKRLTLACTADALNTSTIAGVLYNENGSVASGQVKFSATVSQPLSKIYTLAASGVYYLGVAQSRPLGAGSNHGLTISAIDGPADPLAPTLTPGPGTVTVSWQSDPNVGSYSLFYGQPVPWQTDLYQSGITELEDIVAIDGELSRTITLPPEETYGFWLEWIKDGITATGQIVWDQYSHGTSGVGNPATAAAFHVTSTVNTDWTCEAIGKIPDGNASYDAGVYTVTGAGLLGLSGDDPRPTWLQFLHQPTTENFTITLRVTAIGGNGTTGLASQAGIAVRSDLSPESDELLFGAEAGQKNVVLTYPQTGEGGNSPWSIADDLPVWLKVQRTGSLIESLYSTDGVLWIEVNPYGGYDPILGDQWLDMNLIGTVELGMYVIGNDWDTQVTAVFDNVSITAP